MYIFQEILEDIIEKNKNLRLLNKSLNKVYDSCIIENKYTGEQFALILDEKKDEVIIKEIENYFVNNIYKEIKMSIDDLEAFFSSTNKQIFSETIEYIEDKKDLVLLGIFVKNGIYLESEYDKLYNNFHQSFYFYVLEESHNMKYFIVLSESNGMCGSGYTTATFGDINVISPRYEVNMDNAIYIPKKKLYLEIQTEDESINFFIKKTKTSSISYKDMIGAASYDGGDSYYPSGYITLYLPTNLENIENIYSNEDFKYLIQFLSLNNNYKQILYEDVDIDIDEKLSSHTRDFSRE